MSTTDQAPDSPVAQDRTGGQEPQNAAVTRWRKKPVVIEALHWDGYPTTATVIIDWMLASDGTARYHDDPSALSIDTLEGTMTAVPGDYVIKGIKGEFYSCKPDIFEATYEPASGAEDRTEGQGAETAGTVMRAGRTLGRTLYRVTPGDDRLADVCIGMVDTPELADLIVQAVNAEANALLWGTSCTSCARVLDSAAAETFRREAAEEKLAQVREAILQGGQDDASVRRRVIAMFGRLAAAAAGSGVE